nr:right-handed parallel beta-helix repeat-containing protein [Candidatus Sigynarchaeota archaeon]
MRRRQSIKKAISAMIFMAIISVSYLFSDPMIIDEVGKAFGRNAHLQSSAGTISIKTANWGGYNITGTGGQYDPYIIENRIIDGQLSSNGISIDGGGGRYFIIRNCTITNCRVGIKLCNLLIPGQGVVTNNTVTNMHGNASTYTGVGIYISSASGINITRNVIQGCYTGPGSESGIGIALHNSDHNFIKDNRIETSRATSNEFKSRASGGMLFFDSNYNEVTGNTVLDVICGNYNKPDSGNGIYFFNGQYNSVMNNTIHGIHGGYNLRSGNGILIFKYSGVVESNQVINNTIYDVTAGANTNCKWSGNGIAVVTDEPHVLNTVIQNNIIHDCSVGVSGAYYSGNGVQLYNTQNTVVDGNTISDVSGVQNSGCGIQLYSTNNADITNNIITNCIGSSTYGGNGIMLATSENDNTISHNIVRNTRGGNGQFSGNGIMINDEDRVTVSNNTVVNASYSAFPAWVLGAGVGITLNFEVDYGTITDNEIRDCINNLGIYLYYDSDSNYVARNRISGSTYGIGCEGITDRDSKGNFFFENVAPKILMGSWSDGNGVEDNVVDTVQLYGSRANTIVGNKNSTGGRPVIDVTNTTGYKDSQYWLKITSITASCTLKGAGGIPLTFKHQFYGTRLGVSLDLNYGSGGNHVFDDFYPRVTDGLMYIPWRANDTYRARLYAFDPANPWETSIESLWSADFTLSNIAKTNALIIDGNEGVGGLQDFATRGSGIFGAPYYIENRVIDVSSNGTVDAGITIRNTDAYFVLRNCTVVGGVAKKGIILNNVTNGKIEDCTILGLPSTYVPQSVSADSTPMERGIVLDANCRDNSITRNTVFRTRSDGILVEGDDNDVSSNVISIALWNGINVTGSYNRVCNNTITPFGGPDDYLTHKDDGYWFYTGVDNNALFGVRIA